MYLRAQGLRSSDAYRILQLAPRAPHELIVEVYWALVSRTRRGDSPALRGDDLGAAYALLVDEERPRDSDRRDADHPESHYTTLCVDPAADAGIIAAAYSFLERNRQRMKRPEWRAIEEAHRIVSNPKLRAQYDASRAAVEPSPSAPTLSPVDDRSFRPQPEAGTPGKRRGLFGRSEPGPELAAGDQRLLALRGAALASLPEPSTPPVPMPVLTADTIAEVVFVAGPQAGLRVPLSEHALALGASPEDHVYLDGLGVHDAVHIWQHGDRFMLRQHGTGAVLIEGQRLALPVMALDDGDEITIAGHRLRFRRIPPA